MYKEVENCSKLDIFGGLWAVYMDV